MIRRVISVLSVAIVLLCSWPIALANAESFASDITRATGSLGVSVAEAEALLDTEAYENSQNSSSSVNLPTAVDNSASIYFPPIGDQLTQPSCVGWATTYYAFTYYANKLHNTSAATAANQYSPAWTYNMLTVNNTSGLYLVSALKFLKNHGAVSMSELPYDATTCGTFPSEDAIRNAMNTRVSAITSYKIDTSNQTVFDNSFELNEVKKQLAQGNVLMVELYFGEAQKAITASGETVLYRAIAPGSGHAMTVVGYDDNFSYNVNGDADIDDAEKGAFKVVNSWGEDTASSPDGYTWVLYDALNRYTEIPGDWEPDNTQRIQAFTLGTVSTAPSYFYKIGVSDYEPVLMAKANITFKNKFLYRENLASEQRFLGWFKSEHTQITMMLANVNVTNTLYYDYSSLANPIETYATNSRLYLTLNQSLDGYSDNVINSLKLVDNFNAEIDSFEPLTDNISEYNYDYYANLSLQRGDVNYDSIINTNDAFMVYQIASSGLAISHLLEYMADVNQDGAVDMRDANILFRQTSGG